MNPLSMLLPLACLLLLGCAQQVPAPDAASAPEAGPAAALSGQVTYGQGDCMPLINEAARVYRPYTGELYFVRRAALDQLGAGSWEQLKAASPHVAVRAGQLAVDLPADTYVVMPADVYLATAANTVVVPAGGTGVREDFKFWKCLSY
jgi:hypothetical protein